jgi:hypothetical protein
MTVVLQHRHTEVTNNRQILRMGEHQMKLLRQRVILGGGLLLCGMPAYAYIDPGTGSALIQGVIAAIAAVGITLKLYWHRVTALIGRWRSQDSPPTAKPAAPPESKHTPT